MTINPAQCRAARGLVELDQGELASLASISRNTVADFERGKRTPNANNLAALRIALETAGVEFIPENGGGAGVRLRKRRDGSEGDHAKPAGPAKDAIERIEAEIAADRGKGREP